MAEESQKLKHKVLEKATKLREERKKMPELQ